MAISASSLAIHLAILATRLAILATRLAILAILAAYVSVSTDKMHGITVHHHSIAHTAAASAAILTPTRGISLHSIKGLSSLLILSSCTSS